MWIFTSDAFVSIVEHRDDPGLLIVRGRFPGDAARFLGLPAASEAVTTAADYRYRVIVMREIVEIAMRRAANEINYPNFKDSIRMSWRKAIAMRVWSILFQAQGDRSRLEQARNEAAHEALSAPSIAPSYAAGGIVPNAPKPRKLLEPGEAIVEAPGAFKRPRARKAKA